jgi:hypothetical protein
LSLWIVHVLSLWIVHVLSLWIVHALYFFLTNLDIGIVWKSNAIYVNLFEIHIKLVHISEMLRLCNVDTKRYGCEQEDMNLMLSVLGTANNEIKLHYYLCFLFNGNSIIMKSQFYEISKTRSIRLTNTGHRQLSLSNVSVISC